ncbi:MAG: hypothetical protein M1357_00475 [Candidatus Marsarchaeota archaeon]|nr:hypothetical protein [Candidatus Marsarchaeota archaeon]
MVFSTADPASMCMRPYLERSVEECGAAEEVSPLSTVFCTIDKEPVYADRGDLPPADSYIFLSRHSGKVPCITLHSTGNPTGEARLGGEARKLGLASPCLIGSILFKLTDAVSPLPVVLEATHHGPTSLDKPLVFVEIGVGPEQWTDDKVLSYVARCVTLGLGTHNDVGCVASTFYGGLHYAEKFTRFAVENKLCVGHIISKYAISDETLSLVSEAPMYSSPYSTQVTIDKKGLRGSLRTALVKKADEKGWPVRLI